MPKKFYRKRRKTRRRKKLSIGRLAYKKVRKLEKNIEIKYQDYEINTSVTSDGLMQFLMSQITKGVNENERIGDHIYAKSLLLRFNFNQVSALGTVLYRIILIQDKDNSVSTVNQVLATTTSADHEMQVIRHYNKDSRQDFRVLFDRTFRVSQNTSQNKMWKKYVKLNFDVKYLQSSFSLDKNEIALLMITNVNPLVTDHPWIVCNMRFSYTDT